MSYYERRRPHWQPEGAGLFLTWRLHGSLPREVLEARQEDDAGREFLRQDRVLDAAQCGPTWLLDERVAAIVQECLRYGAEVLKLYELQAWVIMSNHVHLFVCPQAELARINASLRTFSAREANKVLGRRGPFWQHESFDHWSRDLRESEKIIAYIEENPVKAGIVRRASDYRWSSAYDGKAGE